MNLTRQADRNSLTLEDFAEGEDWFEVKEMNGSRRLPHVCLGILDLTIWKPRRSAIHQRFFRYQLLTIACQFCISQALSAPRKFQAISGFSVGPVVSATSMSSTWVQSIHVGPALFHLWRSRIPRLSDQYSKQTERTEQSKLLQPHMRDIPTPKSYKPPVWPRLPNWWFNRNRLLKLFRLHHRPLELPLKPHIMFHSTAISDFSFQMGMLQQLRVLILAIAILQFANSTLFLILSKLWEVRRLSTLVLSEIRRFRFFVWGGGSW